MTPEEAAQTLGIDPGASRQQIDRAYRRVAREWHPDRHSDAPMREQVKAQAEFVRAGEARAVMLALTAEPVGVADAAASGPRRPPKTSWPLLATWVVVLFLAIAVSTVGSSLPLTIWEPVVRFGLMTIAAVGFALTGSRVFLVLLGISIAATAVITIVFTTFGSLLGMLLLAAPLYGLYIAGRGRRGYRVTAARSRGTL